MSNWMRVVFSSECDEDGNCPQCGFDCAECECPGPTMDDEYDYKFDENDVMWARRKDEGES